MRLTISRVLVGQVINVGLLVLTLGETRRRGRAVTIRPPLRCTVPCLVATAGTSILFLKSSCKVLILAFFDLPKRLTVVDILCDLCFNALTTFAIMVNRVRIVFPTV